MGLENRPYVGTWKLAQKALVQHTPDALVYINGDVAVPGCPKCNGRIDIQRFLTDVSVDAGTDPAGASATFSLSIPLHHNESFARDAKFILRPGLEVHIYMRGYFPVPDMYAGLAQSNVNIKEIASPETTVQPKAGVQPYKSDNIDASTLTQASSCKSMQAQGLMSSAGCGPEFMTDQGKALLADRFPGQNLSAEQITANINETAATLETIHQYTQQLYPGQKVSIETHDCWTLSGHEDNSQHKTGRACDFDIKVNGKRLPRIQSWKIQRKLSDNNYIQGGQGLYLSAGAEPSANPPTSSSMHVDTGNKRSWLWVGGQSHYEKHLQANAVNSKKPTAAEKAAAKAWAKTEDAKYYDPILTDLGNSEKFPKPNKTVKKPGQNLKENVPDPVKAQPGEKVPAVPPQTAPSMLAEHGLEGSGLDKLLAYPYYHVFHGVVTSASHQYSGGVNTVSLTCASMLHFWQYQPVSTNASVFGARPVQSGLRTSLIGHNFTNKHPYEIIYTLHHDIAGAAGGVAWSMSNKTNQTSKDTVGGESLFSLNQRYWERRFATRMIKLRMHGASGQLFSTAQAAWLSKTPSQALVNALRGRFAGPSGQKGAGGKDILGQAVFLGLFTRKRSLEALRVGKARAGNSTKFDINAIEIKAFVNNIGKWGQVNLFESSYESKLEIAQRVCEVTGFEFYQDVDGDFVFKPPMYNLDTSSSRVYRIEDIDIININFDEKEPQVTYMTIKAAHFKNLQGTGVENEWGNRGQYIDYRLVAQYGWRPGAFEMSYLNNSMALFFAAVNRMDIINAPTKSASVTIPIRAELRPGYPVFIPYLDCYYYCNSFAHAYAAGGQCTTSMQLIAKRAKFFAPGRSTKQGIDAIDLGDTLLPERPLRIINERTGSPALAGFPNVVMALDPKEVNPLFFIVGADLDRIDDPQVLESLLKRAEFFKILRRDSDGRYLWTIAGGESAAGTQVKEVAFVFQGADGGAATGIAKGSGVKEVDILQAATTYSAQQAAKSKEVSKLRKEIRELRGEVSQLYVELSRIDPTAGSKAQQKAAAKKIKTIQGQLTGYSYKSKTQTKPDPKNPQATVTVKGKTNKVKGKEVSLHEAEASLSNALSSFEDEMAQETGIGISFLLTLIKQVGGEYGKTRGQGSEFGALDSTTNLLDMLSDKKATFSTASTPGHYRYYSCSHPDRTMQGQLQPTFTDQPPEEDFQDSLGNVVHMRNPYLEPVWQDVEVDGFVPTAEIEIPPDHPGGRKPEAQIRPIRPVWGIKVQTSNPDYPKGEVVPTSEIRELLFATHRAYVPTKKARTVWKLTYQGLGASFEKKVVESIGGEAGANATWDTKVESAYYDASAGTGPSPLWWNESQAVIRSAFKTCKEAADSGKVKLSALVPEFPIPEFPPFLRLGKYGVLDTTKPLKSSSDGITESVVATEQAVKVFAEIDEAVGEAFASLLSLSIRTWLRDMEAAFTESHSEKKKWVAQRREKVLNAFLSRLAAHWDAEPAKSSPRRVKVTYKYIETHSPVFPVSDSRGYEVIGSYRYGRDIDINADGVWDEIAKEDPLELLDKTTVERALDVYVRRKSVQVPETVEGPNGKKKTVYKSMNPDQAKTFVEQEIIEQLRANLTDKQILDLGLAEATGDPNKLQFRLANWFADDTKDRNMKVPLNNAAFNLADLTLHTGQEICACKVAEAGSLLDVAAYAEFVPVAGMASEVIAGDADDTTKWLATLSARAGIRWKQSQDALRGTVLDRKPKGNLVDRLKAEGSALAAHAESITSGDIAAGVTASLDRLEDVGEELANFDELDVPPG